MQRAETRFYRLLAKARHAPQTVTRHGKPVVVVVDAAEFARLRRLARGTPSFVDLLLAMPKDDGELERIEVYPRDVEF